VSVPVEQHGRPAQGLCAFWPATSGCLPRPSHGTSAASANLRMAANHVAHRTQSGLCSGLGATWESIGNSQGRNGRVATAFEG